MGEVKMLKQKWNNALHTKMDSNSNHVKMFHEALLWSSTSRNKMPDQKASTPNMLKHALRLHKCCFKIGSSVIYMLMPLFLPVLYALLKLSFWNW
jgi:hypothetical protein